MIYRRVTVGDIYTFCFHQPFQHALRGAEAFNAFWVISGQSHFGSFSFSWRKVTHEGVS